MLPGLLAQHAPPLVHRLVVLLGLPEALSKPEPERAARPVEGHRLSVGLKGTLPGPEAVVHDPAEEVGLRIRGHLGEHGLPFGQRQIPESTVGQVSSQGTMVAAGPGLVAEHAGDEGTGSEGQRPERPHLRLEHSQPIGVQGRGIAEGGQRLSPGEI
jgi:hypothetical protein